MNPIDNHIFGDKDSAAIEIEYYGEETVFDPLTAKVWVEGETAALEYFSKWSDCFAYVAGLPVGEPGEGKIAALVREETTGKTPDWAINDGFVWRFVNATEATQIMEDGGPKAEVLWLETMAHWPPVWDLPANQRPAQTVSTDAHRIKELEAVVARLLASEALSRNVSEADAEIVAQARKMAGSAGARLSTTMSAYSSISPNEMGDEFEADVTINRTDVTIDLGKEDGLSVAFEVRDSTATGEPVPHGELWIGIGPKGADVAMDVTIDLRNGAVLEMENPGTDISMSPLKNDDPVPTLGM